MLTECLGKCNSIAMSRKSFRIWEENVHFSWRASGPCRTSLNIDRAKPGAKTAAIKKRSIRKCLQADNRCARFLWLADVTLMEKRVGFRFHGNELTRCYTFFKCIQLLNCYHRTIIKLYYNITNIFFCCCVLPPTIEGLIPDSAMCRGRGGGGRGLLSSNTKYWPRVGLKLAERRTRSDNANPFTIFLILLEFSSA